MFTQKITWYGCEFTIWSDNNRSYHISSGYSTIFLRREEKAPLVSIEEAREACRLLALDTPHTDIRRGPGGTGPSLWKPLV